MAKKIKFITITINEKAYDLPKDMPLPRLHERVSVDSSDFGIVSDVCYQVMEDFWMVTIRTKPEEI